jgi:branched-chain amino acid transport system permease protein
MSDFFAYTIAGIIYGAGFALIASGLVLTYTTSRIFNMSHGAMAMASAFIYYDLAFRHGWPKALALLVVVGVIAPMFGIIVDRLIMRNLADAPVNISLAVTIGIFLLVYGAILKAFPATKVGTVEPLFPNVKIHIGSQAVNGNDLVTVFTAVGVAVGFYLFFKLTRTGVAMRAVVDNRSLLALHGASPGFMSALSWAVGSALAAVAGVLLSASSSIGLDYIQLTLLVITGYAAAILGRLTNLPLTFLGALILGLSYEYSQAYLPAGDLWTGFKTGEPAIFLFLVLIVLPTSPLRVGQIRGIRSVPVAGWTRTLATGAVVIVGAWMLSTVIGNGSNLNPTNVGLAFVYGTMMLSLVLLTGYGGYLNLAPITFAGIGVLTVLKIGSSSPYVLLVCAAVTGVIGAALGLLAIRLGTLYLAIATLAFAELIDYVVFQTKLGFGSFADQSTIHRWNFFGYHVASDKAYMVFSVIAFVAIAVLVLALRRGRYGRLLIALRDSPAACGTLGLNLTFTRVGVFAISAAIAGFTGAVYGGLIVSVNATQFGVLQNLPIVLMVVVGGLTSVSGALLGGTILVVLTKTDLTIPLIHQRLDSLAGVLIGAAAILLARNPNGLVAYLFQFGRWVLRLGPAGAQPTAPTEGSRAADTLPGGIREEVTVGGPA